MPAEATRVLVGQRQGGSLVGVSSTSAIDGAPGQQHYAASKTALLAVTRGLAVELARHKVLRRLARVEERRDRREHFSGPPCQADVRGAGEHGELRVRQESEQLHHVGQGREVAVTEDQQGGNLQ